MKLQHVKLILIFMSLISSIATKEGNVYLTTHSTHFIYGYMASDIWLRCSSVVRAFAHGAMGRRIDPSWGGPIELFLVPASAPRLV